MKLIAFAISLLPVTAAAAEDFPFFIGTYTDGTSKGIYRAVLDTQTGKLSEPKLAAETAGPSFLALHPGGKFLYAVRESADGQVAAFAVQGDGTLRPLNAESSHGAGPCHVSVDHAGKHLFVANYGGGSLACLPIAEDGSLAAASAVFENTGDGPDRQRQEKPHLHAIYPDADDRFVYACDLGTDEVLVFRFDAAKGTLKSADPRSAKVPPGGGPRHFALHPTGRFAFANNELSNSVTAFGRDPQTGALTPLHTVSTLPDGKPVPGNSTSEISLHPNGKWLYVSNRGHDSIAAYSVGEDGRLELIEIEPAGVAVPRGFGIDPSGRWLVVGGQSSNDLTALAIDPSSGALSPGPNKVAVGSPVCVVFTGDSGAAVSARPVLEFYIAESEPAEGLTKADAPDAGAPLYMHSEPALTSHDIATARPVKDSTGSPAILVDLTPEGGAKLKEATSKNLRKRLAIVVNGKIVAAPTIFDRIERQAQITGQFTQEEVTRIAAALRREQQSASGK